MTRLPPARILRNGSGNCTVLIHGLLASPAFWEGELPRTARSGRTIAYPLPGHHPWTTSPAELDRLLHPLRLSETYATALKRDFGGRKVNLVGHSSGGFVSLLVAARHPELVQSVVLVSGFADGAAARMQPAIERGLRTPRLGPVVFRSLLNLWTANSLTFRAGIWNLISNWRKADQCPRFDAICERVRQDLRASDPQALNRVVNWLRKSRGWQQLPALRHKVCLVAGSDDRIIPITHQRGLAARLGGARFVEVRNAGHLPMVEDRKAFAAAVDRYAMI